MWIGTIAIALIAVWMGLSGTELFEIKGKIVDVTSSCSSTKADMPEYVVTETYCDLCQDEVTVRACSVKLFNKEGK